jgi:lipopolysaccharide transport system ATP-binding protein
MADEVVIHAEGLGKKYLIGHAAERERYVALRDVLARGARSAWRKTLDLARGRAIVAGDTVEEFWALKDISFEVERSEVLGIIGRNGAGKTTLLKILSRVTEPSEGRVTIRGRVASLLEVGTGFHPELTGRENIYLNGAILGMTRAEIRKKFDEIVAFAEVEKFLDTPVKRYSSGMYVRLAFGVAAYLEPEILVVDEVLAVGDIGFQQKSLQKMHDVSFGEGRTVLFVSHNLEAIQTICNRCIWFDRGVVKADGRPNLIVTSFLKALSNSGANEHSGELWVEKVEYMGSHSDIEGLYQAFEPIGLRITFQSRQDIEGMSCGIGLINNHGQLIFGINSREIGIKPTRMQATATLEIIMPNQNLLPGRYDLWLQLHDGHSNMLFDERNVSAFYIAPPVADAYRPMGAGVVHIDTSWKWI